MNNQQKNSTKKLEDEQNSCECLFVRRDQIEDAMALFKERGLDVEFVQEDELKGDGTNE